MRKLFYGVAYDKLGNTHMHELTHTSARDAQDWIEYQRDQRGDTTRYTVVRIAPTTAR